MFLLPLLLYLSCLHWQGSQPVSSACNYAEKKKRKMKTGSSSKGQLLPWLLKALDNSLYEGMRWEDKFRRIFYVHWTHKTAVDWSLSEIEVCQEWAAYKGKLNGKNEKQLKATFRCALNSKNELQELRAKRTKRRRYWQFLDNSKSGEPKESKKGGKNEKLAIWNAEKPGTSADNICDRLSPTTVNFNHEDFRLSCSPPSEQNRLTPPADIPPFIYQHSSSINKFHRTSSDVWQPNFMSIPNGLQDFFTFNQFAQEIDELIRPISPEKVTDSHMLDVHEMSQDQFVPVMNTFQNSLVPMEQFSCTDKAYSSSTLYDSTILDEGLHLDSYADPIDCEKLIQELNMLTSAYAGKHEKHLRQQYPLSYEALT